MDVALIEPKTPENVGSVARAMANFGFSDLIIAEPRCDVLSLKARALASHAQSILESAKVVSIDSVFARSHVIGTTSKLGSDYNLNRTPVPLEDFAKSISPDNPALLSSLKQAVFVFGREGDGLTNDELESCDVLLTIPASDYPVLNLSHAVAIVLYELSKHRFLRGHASKFPVPSASDRGRLKQVLRDLVLVSDTPDHQKKNLSILLNRIFGSSFIGARQHSMLMGFFRNLFDRLR